MSRARRLLVALATFLGVALIAFLLVELVPGDPAAARLGTGGDETARVALREALGLHGPPLVRLGHWLAGLAHLDLGRALVDGRPVRDKILERLPPTLAVALV